QDDRTLSHIDLGPRGGAQRGSAIVPSPRAIGRAQARSVGRRWRPKGRRILAHDFSGCQRAKCLRSAFPAGYAQRHRSRAGECAILFAPTLFRCKEREGGAALRDVARSEPTFRRRLLFASILFISLLVADLMVIGHLAFTDLSYGVIDHALRASLKSLETRYAGALVPDADQSEPPPPPVEPCPAGEPQSMSLVRPCPARTPSQSLEPRV